MYYLIDKNLLNIGFTSIYSSNIIYNTAGNDIFDKKIIKSLLIKFYLKYLEYLLFINDISSNLYCNSNNNSGIKKYTKFTTSNYVII